MTAIYQYTPEIAAEGLVQLEDTLGAVQLFYRDYEPYFTSGLKKGDTIKIRKPPVFVAQEFAGTVIHQEIQESLVDLQLEKHLDVTVDVTSKDLTLALRDFNEQIALPAVRALSTKIENYILSKYVNIAQFAGTTSTRWNSLAAIQRLNSMMTHRKIGIGNRFALIDPFTTGDIMSTGDMVRADAVGDAGATLRDAIIGKKGGINWYTSEQLGIHTYGGATNGTIKGGKVQNALAIGATAMTVFDTTFTGSLKIGDLFTIAGSVDYRGVPNQYRVTAAVTATGNAAVVSFYPALPAAVTANTIVTFVDTSPVGIGGDRRGLAYAIVAPEAPIGDALPATTINYKGIGIRVVFGYNTETKMNTVSFDCLVGAAVIQPELLFRLIGDPTLL